VSDSKQSKIKSVGHTPLFVGLGLLLIIIGFAYFTPIPSNWQQNVFVTVLALSAAGVAAIIPGFIEVEYKGFLRAGGAIAVFCIVYFFKPQTPITEQSISLTILVHGPDGRQDIILENRGYLIIDLIDDRRKIRIGENGRTFLGGIPATLRNQKISIGLDEPGFELVDVQKEYSIENKPIYVEIKKVDQLSSSKPEIKKTNNPKNLNVPTNKCSIIGIIKDKYSDRTISKARITLICDSVFRTESDSEGYFSISVPGKLKGERCMIRAESAGKSKELYIPICDPNLIELKIE